MIDWFMEDKETGVFIDSTRIPNSPTLKLSAQLNGNPAYIEFDKSPYSIKNERLVEWSTVVTNLVEAEVSGLTGIQSVVINVHTR